MIDRFLRELASELRAVGVRNSAAKRVLAEARDHLEEAARAGGDPVERFGDPMRFARQVATELGTARTCRATYVTFGALAVAGIAFVVSVALVPAAGGWPDLVGGRLVVVGPTAALALLVLPQVAFVSGGLALVRALRLRTAREVRGEQLALLRRRSNAALVATGLTLLALATTAFVDGGQLASWWRWSTIALCLALGPPLVAAAYTVSDSACPSVPAGGRAGDVFDDLAPVLSRGPLHRLDLPGHPWRFALLIAAGVGFAAFVLGWYAEGDPGSGFVRGVFEATALLVCFAALGRPLGLRRTSS